MKLACKNKKEEDNDFMKLMEKSFQRILKNINSSWICGISFREDEKDPTIGTLYIKVKNFKAGSPKIFVYEKVPLSYYLDLKDIRDGKLATRNKVVPKTKKAKIANKMNHSLGSYLSTNIYAATFGPSASKKNANSGNEPIFTRNDLDIEEGDVEILMENQRLTKLNKVEILKKRKLLLEHLSSTQKTQKLFENADTNRNVDDNFESTIIDASDVEYIIFKEMKPKKIVARVKYLAENALPINLTGLYATKKNAISDSNVVNVGAKVEIYLADEITDNLFDDVSKVTVVSVIYTKIDSNGNELQVYDKDIAIDNLEEALNEIKKDL